MPRKKSGDTGVGSGPPQNAPRQRQRKKKEPVIHNDMKMEIPQPGMSYENQVIPNGVPPHMLPDEGQYGRMHHEYYYPPGGPQSTASVAMTNGYGAPNQPPQPPPPPNGGIPLGPGGPYQDIDMNPAHGQPSIPPPYMQPPGSQQPQGMMPPPQSNMPPPHAVNVQNPTPNGAPAQVAASAAQSHMVMRQMQVPNSMPFPQPPLLEYRIMEMNKRMYSFYHPGVPQQDHAQWWEAFGHEFFDDDAKASIVIYETAEVAKKYTIGKLSINRFFRTMFATGVRELNILPRGASSEKLSQWGACALECDNVVMLTKIDKPLPVQVITDARLFVEFSPYDEAVGYRIKQFTMELKNAQEYVLSHANLDMESQEKLRHGLTKCGITQEAVEFLRVCVIMEPMQPIMTICKLNPQTQPRDALKNILFNHYNQRKTMPLPGMNAGVAAMPPPGQTPGAIPPQGVDDTVKKQPRKRTRKANTNTTSPTKQRKGNSRSSPAQSANNFPMNQSYPVSQYQEVLVVGEPSLMGGDFGEDDERAISRIENTQYDGSLSHANNNSFSHTSGNNTPMSAGLQANGSNGMFNRQNSFNRNTMDMNKMPPPQAANVAPMNSGLQSNLNMLQPPPSYESSMIGGSNSWNTMGSSSMTTPLLAQAICEP